MEVLENDRKENHMDYKQFREEHGISTKEMICTVSAVCPKFTKMQLSMVDQPEKYGVCLIPSMDKRLIEVFGKVEHLDGEEPVPKKKPNRTKPERFTFRLTKKKADKLRKIRAKLGVTTQELVCDVMENYIENFSFDEN